MMFSRSKNQTWRREKVSMLKHIWHENIHNKSKRERSITISHYSPAKFYQASIYLDCGVGGEHLVGLLHGLVPVYLEFCKAVTRPILEALVATGYPPCEEKQLHLTKTLDRSLTTVFQEHVTEAASPSCRKHRIGKEKRLSTK